MKDKADAMEDSKRLGGVIRNKRFGTKGRKSKHTVNYYPMDLTELPYLIYIYDVTMAEIESDSNNDRGGSGGGRGRSP